METVALDFAARLSAVRARIQQACERSGRRPDEVRLIGATKTLAPETVALALAAGLRDIGENTVQEAAATKRALGDAASAATWHLIGHLQTNKVADALALFDVIHSVDSVRLAEHLSARAQKTVPVLLEVNVAGEESKFGFAPGEVSGVLSRVASLPNLEVRGLMTVAPAVAVAEEVRPVFRTLRELAEANGLRELSMGMTDVFEVAIEEGATMVRVGRAHFGERMSR